MISSRKRGGSPPRD